MPNDAELLEKLIESTSRGSIEWKPTAVDEQFSAAFGGKWEVTLDRGTDRGTRNDYWLTLRDADGTNLLVIEGNRDYRVKDLFEAARRLALNVDKAIADVLKELDKPEK